MLTPSLSRLCPRRARCRSSPVVRHRSRRSLPFPSNRARYASEREPRISEHGVVTLGIMRAAQKRAVKIRRAAIEVQILRELQAEPHVPGGIRERRAVTEGEVGEVEDEAIAVGTADVTVVGPADAGRRAIGVVARSVKIAVPGAGDVEIAKAYTVGVVPHERGIGLEAVERVVEIRRYGLPVRRVQPLPFHDIGQLHGHAVLVARVLDLRIEPNVEKIVRPVAVDAAGGDLTVHPQSADLPEKVAPMG